MPKDLYWNSTRPSRSNWRIFSGKKSVGGSPQMTECHTMRNNKAIRKTSPGSPGVLSVGFYR
jgi:hypothetical protein